MDLTAQGVHYCVSDIVLKNSKDETFSLPEGMISIASPNHAAIVSYTMTHMLTKNINWKATLYLDNSIGLIECHSKLSELDQQTALKSYCYDCCLTVHLFLNVGLNAANHCFPNNY